MHHLIKTAAFALMAVLVFAGCESEPTTAEKVAAERNKGVDEIRSQQKVNPMKWSPTLSTINRWAETWGQQGKVSYVYMQRQDGEFAGYYVLDGLPVNYCVSGSPTYDMYDVHGDSMGPSLNVPAPALDGAYYGGCDSSRYYGFDAVTGQYIEYTDGLVLTAVLSDQPLSLDKQPRALGGSTIEEVERDGQ